LKSGSEICTKNVGSLAQYRLDQTDSKKVIWNVCKLISQRLGEIPIEYGEVMENCLDISSICEYYQGLEVSSKTILFILIFLLGYQLSLRDIVRCKGEKYRDIFHGLNSMVRDILRKVDRYSACQITV